MKKPTIGVDLDCTLSQMMKVWLEKYNEEYEDDIKESDITDWDITKFIKPEAKDSGAMWRYLRESDVFKVAKKEEYAKEGLKFLTSFAEVYIVTAYVPESCLDKANWVKKEFPFFDTKNIVFCNNKGLMNLDFLIDDGLHNFENFKGTPIIFDKPWNKKSKYIRFRNWKEIKKFFESVKEKWIK